MKDTLKNQKGIDTMTKPTKKVALRVALDALEMVKGQMTPAADWTFEEVEDKLREMVAQLEKPRSSKPTKAQEEREGLKAKVMAFMEGQGKMRATDVAKALELSSGQKAAALLGFLLDEGKVVRTQDKGVVLWEAAPAVAPQDE